MSHYSVAVFTKENQSVDGLLKPFDESIRVAPYVYKTKEQIIEDAKSHKQSIMERMSDPKYQLSDWEKNILNCKTDEEFHKIYMEDEEYDENGNKLSTYNPNSKWDWYVVGGRWSELLPTKDGKKVNSCLVKDLDLSIDKEKYDKAIRFWELVVEDQPLKDGEKRPFNWYKKEYYINRYETKENYAKKCSTLSTYAVLTPDGEWFEPGQMGWWGISYASTEDNKAWDEAYSKFLEEADLNWTITVVDCHI